MSRGVLYVIACAAGATRTIPGKLLPLLADRGWDTYILATLRAVESFPDTMAEIETATGRPIRTASRTTFGYQLADPDAVLVAPATYNTVVKMAAGIADTYVLTRLAEQIGRGVPIVVAPYLGVRFAGHPVYEPSLATLRSWGVRVIPHQSGPGAAATFPWAELVDALNG